MSDKDTKTQVAIAQAELKYNSQFDRQVDFDNRIIRINGEIDDDEFNRVDAAMTIMEKQNKRQITIRINSYGGEVYSALAIVGRINKSNDITVVTEGYGKIMSAAVLILACGDKRRVSSLAWLMHHEASYDLSGRVSSIKHELAQLEKEEDQWAEHMAELTTKSKEFWTSAGVGKDLFLDANQMLEHGVVDELF